ncbi:DUF6516 family protein [[Phormidium] sp. ETS-05]|uniref:toxin-antitoxin system TumE family protein n=1 Tax=[Phormidium] sp. ETS-05 TaxID=222819 RepID=UPI0018EF10E0|nr:DUF6516 family protein [[Phormidium] sp. ETS-05]
MNNSRDYIERIKALIVSSSQFVNYVIVREESQGDRGLFRYRLTMQDGSFLELFEFFMLDDAEVQVTKYSFHWQNADGQLRKRWDNAAHHQEISTYPHHIHDGTEENVMPHQPVNAEDILEIVARLTKT